MLKGRFQTSQTLHDHEDHKNSRSKNKFFFLYFYLEALEFTIPKQSRNCQIQLKFMISVSPSIKPHKTPLKLGITKTKGSEFSKPVTKMMSKVNATFGTNYFFIFLYAFRIYFLY